MLRKLFDLWIFFYIATLTILLALAHAQQLPVSLNLIQRVYYFPSWLTVLLLLGITVILGCVWLKWYIRAICLTPIIIFGLAVPGAWFYSGMPLITGMIAGHLYGGMAINFLLVMAVLHDNAKIRDEREQLKREIRADKSLLKDVIAGNTNGAK